MAGLKPVLWVAGSRATLREFPVEVQRVTGRALAFAQRGEKAPGAEPLKGFGGAGVLEIVADEEGNTYRGGYTVRLASWCTRCTCSTRSHTRASALGDTRWS